MLVLDDIAKLWAWRDPHKSVQVVKHEYEPKDAVKYLDNIQYRYPRKNWTSVMLFNCDHPDCRNLTPEYVNEASGLDLHRLTWTDDPFIGELPAEWNHLVSEYAPNKNAKLVHYTVGTPCFEEYMNCEFADEWYQEKALMNSCTQLKDIKKLVQNKLK